MDVPEAARFLQIPERRLRRWLAQGLLHTTGADRASFDRESLAAWARKRGMRVASPDAPPPTDPLCAALDRGSTLRAVAAETAAEAIAHAVDSIARLDEDARSAVLDAVLDRERMASTGLGGGIAVPHPRIPLPDLVPTPTVVCVFPATPLDWMGADRELVHSVFLVVAPNAPSQLAILSRIARLARAPGVAEFLREHPVHEALIARTHDVLGRA